MPISDLYKIHDQFLAAVAARDVDALMTMYADDALALDATGAQCSGPAEIEAMLTAFVTAVRGMTGTTRKILVSGDVALTSATWSGEAVGPDGTVQTLTGITAEVSRRMPDGTWRMIIDDPVFL